MIQVVQLLDWEKLQSGNLEDLGTKGLGQARERIKWTGEHTWDLVWG